MYFEPIEFHQISIKIANMVTNKLKLKPFSIKLKSENKKTANSSDSRNKDRTAVLLSVESYQSSSRRKNFVDEFRRKNFEQCRRKIFVDQFRRKKSKTKSGGKTEFSSGHHRRLS